MNSWEGLGLDGTRDRIAASSAEEVFAASIGRAREIADLGAFLVLAEQSGTGLPVLGRGWKITVGS